MKLFLFRLLRLMVGYFIYATGMVFCIQGNLGYSPGDILNNGFSHIFGCSFGTSSITIAFILILVLLLFKQKIGIGTIGNMIFLGLFCDFLLESGWIPLMHTWYMGILFIIIGAAILAFATYLYVGAGFYAGPRDGIMLLFTEKSGWPVGLCRILIDITTAGVGYLMGGFLGIGSVVNVLVMGPMIQLMFRIFHFDSKAVQHESVADTYRFLRDAMRAKRAAHPIDKD